MLHRGGVERGPERVAHEPVEQDEMADPGPLLGGVADVVAQHVVGVAQA
jgi:hypothetical protein